MGCEWLKGPGGTTIHIRTSGVRKKKCPFCKRGSVAKECDYPIGHGKTCDAGMCAQCATTIGRQDTNLGNGFSRPNDTVDVCPIHDGKAWPSPDARPVSG